MDFDALDKQMRYFEQTLDRVMIKGIFLVARLDGHGFTKLTKKQLDLEKPFDIRFRDMMINTLKQLLDCGFRVVYGYTQSDEISILFHFDENTFARKERKLLSILAGEASATFSLLAGCSAVFDCRLVPLRQVDDVGLLQMATRGCQPKCTEFSLLLAIAQGGIIRFGCITAIERCFCE